MRTMTPDNRAELLGRRRQIRRAFLRLLPHTPLWLNHLLVDIKLGEHFRHAFRRAWPLIPFASRRTLLRFWRAGFGGDGLAEVNPWIELLPHRIGGEGEMIDAQVKKCGHKLQFFGPLVKIMPMRPLIGLILHETAHCYAWATGAPGHRKDEDNDHWQMERVCGEIQKEWGVYKYERLLDRWQYSHEERLEALFEAHSG